MQIKTDCYLFLLRSFGVLIWEIMTVGQFPYTELTDAEVVHRVCYEYQRLLQPLECPENMWAITTITMETTLCVYKIITLRKMRVDRCGVVLGNNMQHVCIYFGKKTVNWNTIVYSMNKTDTSLNWLITVRFLWNNQWNIIVETHPLCLSALPFSDTVINWCWGAGTRIQLNGQACCGCSNSLRLVYCHNPEKPLLFPLLLHLTQVLMQ